MTLPAFAMPLLQELSKREIWVSLKSVKKRDIGIRKGYECHVRTPSPRDSQPGGFFLPAGNIRLRPPFLPFSSLSFGMSNRCVKIHKFIIMVLTLMSNECILYT